MNRSTEDIAIDVQKRFEAIKRGVYSGPDDTRYLLELLYEDVAEFMELVVTWQRTREELEGSGGHLGLG